MKNIKNNWLIYSFILILTVIIVLIFLPNLLTNKPEKESSLDLKTEIDREFKNYDIIDGSNQAKLTLVVYESYFNSFNDQLRESINYAKDEFGHDLMFIYRPFISNNLKEKQASLLVICANNYNQGKIARDLMYNKNKEEFSLDNLDDYASKLSLDRDKLFNCIDIQEKNNLLIELEKNIKDNNIYGSPTILINDEIIIGARPYQDFVDSNNDYIEGLRSVIARHLND